MSSSTPRAAAISGIAALLLFSSVATEAVASNTDTKQQDRQAAAVTKYVNQKLRTWQDRMNLRDWNIQVDVVRATQLEPRTLGNIHWDTNIKAATIDVLSPLDYQLAYQPMLKDMEFTIVHELVHLELASMPKSDASRRVEEKAVNELAGALLRLAQ